MKLPMRAKQCFVVNLNPTEDFVIVLKSPSLPFETVKQASERCTNDLWCSKRVMHTMLFLRIARHKNNISEMASKVSYKR